MLIVQITRGLAPAEAIAGAARQLDAVYELISGKPLVEAKNAATNLALSMHMDMVFIEDDIVAGIEVWDAARICLKDEAVGYARGRIRGNQESVYCNPVGEFLYAWTGFVAIPLCVLECLPRPLFEARRWSPDRDEMDLSPRGLQDNGVGSDTGFWWHVRHLEPAPEIRELGRVRHLKHALNVKRDNLTPCEISEW